MERSYSLDARICVPTPCISLRVFEPSGPSSLASLIRETRYFDYSSASLLLRVRRRPKIVSREAEFVSCVRLESESPASVKTGKTKEIIDRFREVRI